MKNIFNITKDQLYQMYIVEDLKVSEMARFYGCSDKNIRAHLNAFSIPKKKKKRINLKQDLLDKKFGKLTVIKLHHIENEYENFWLCKCICDNEIVISAQNLICSDNRRIRSCGCSRRKTWKSVPPFYWKSLETKAIRRGIEFQISREFGEKLLENQNNKYAISGIEITIGRRMDSRKHNTTASLDRINSNLPYVENNVQWIHKQINIMKNTLTDQELINWCKIITEHNK